MCSPRPSGVTGNSAVWNLTRIGPRAVTSLTIYGESFLLGIPQTETSSDAVVEKILLFPTPVEVLSVS